MKLIHCADIHLASKMAAHLEEWQARERNLELLHTFEQMVQFGEQQQVKAVLISGDLFDESEVPVFVENGFLDVIVQHPVMDFFWLRGNHDRNVAFRATELPDNLHLFSENWLSYSYGDVTITGVECIGNSMTVQAQQLHLKPEDLNIVMLHGMLVGQPSTDVTEDQIPMSLLQEHAIDYLALGHVHQHQTVRLDQRGIACYSGCLEGRGFDECGEKGFVFLDIEETSRQIRAQFVPFGYRTVYEIPVDVSDCMTSTQILRAIRNELDETGVEEKDLVRVILTGEVDVACEKNISYIERQLEEAYYCFRLIDDTKIYVKYSDYVIDQTLKGEFVRMVQETDLTEQEKGEVIRAGLMALAGEEWQL